MASLQIVTDFAYCSFREVLWFVISAEIRRDSHWLQELILLFFLLLMGFFFSVAKPIRFCLFIYVRPSYYTMEKMHTLL